MPIQSIKCQSTMFAQVQMLWRGESATLGFMPEGGFLQAAEQGTLLASVSDQGTLQGYVLFRRTCRKQSSIVHLCVANSCRGMGVARHLFDAVKDCCRECAEIRLRCRRDFPANAMWPKLGFVAVAEEPAKSANSFLVTWRYELAAPPLLRLFENSRPRHVTRAVIDANVFFDLDEGREGYAESAGLVADWLTDYVELVVTPELANEINRRDSKQDRDRQHARASRFVQLTRDIAREDVAFAQIDRILPFDDRPSGLSDRRQLAMTVAASISFFVTRDDAILDAAEPLYDRFDLRVLRPHELVLDFDRLRREEEYRPRRFYLGPMAQLSRPEAGDVERLADLMHAGQSPPEPRRRTIARLQGLLAAPTEYDARCVMMDGDLLATYVLDRRDSLVLSVPYFAVSDKAHGPTAARHYGEHLLAIAAEEKRQVVHVLEPGARVGEALAELGFSHEQEGWIKLVLRFVGTIEDACTQLDRASLESARMSSLAGRLARELRANRQDEVLPVNIAEIERNLWPAKLMGTGLPCFIVPIQPRWAAQLFDRTLASQTLFGGPPNLMLKPENVYYRSARPAILKAPGRILWYISEDSAFPGSMAIRACSYIDEILLGKPKETFSRFKRLGIFHWKDVLELAKGDLDAFVMAFRFSKTEEFRRPIEWNTLQQVLQSHTGKRSQIQSPVSISEPCFLDLYRRGTEGTFDAN